MVVERRIVRAAARSAAERRWHHEQKWVARPPTTIRRIGRPHRKHGSPAPLVDPQVLLHLAVAVGRRVVVDRRTAPDDGLGEDPSELQPEAAFVGGPQRPRRPEGMEAGGPERLVGVDVADAGDERLVEEERLEAALPAADPAPKRRHGERVRERLGARLREGIVVRGDVQPHPTELADVAEPDLPAVLELEHESDVRIVRNALAHDEQLAGHLEVDRQEGVAVERDDDLLAAPRDALDPATRDAGRELLRRCCRGAFGPSASSRRRSWRR